MLAIFDDSGNRLSHTYNGLTLNSITAATPTTGPSGYRITACVPLVQLDSVSDPHQTRDGMESYDARKVSLVYQVQGEIQATTLADLFDKMKALAKAFDPAKVSHENASTEGYLAYDFSVPTADTANYASGFVPSRYYFRARAVPTCVVSSYTAFVAAFTLELVARDPRRYLQTTSSITAAGTLDNSLADYRSWPTLTLTMGGAGSASATITNSTTGKSLVLDLSSCVAADVVVVDFENRSITKNGVDSPSLEVAASGDFWEVEPESQTVATANFTNVSSWSLAWRRAFCL